MTNSATKILTTVPDVRRAAWKSIKPTKYNDGGGDGDQRWWGGGGRNAGGEHILTGRYIRTVQSRTTAVTNIGHNRIDDSRQTYFVNIVPIVFFVGTKTRRVFSRNPMTGTNVNWFLTEPTCTPLDAISNERKTVTRALTWRRNGLTYIYIYDVSFTIVWGGEGGNIRFDVDNPTKRHEPHKPLEYIVCVYTISNSE